MGTTLRTPCGGDATFANTVVEATPYMLKIRTGVAIDSAGKAAGKGALVQEDKAMTLATTQDQYLFQPVVSGGFCPEQSAKTRGIGWEEEMAPTLRAGVTPACVYSVENHPADSRVDIDDSGKVQTLTSRMGTGGGNVPMVLESEPIAISSKQQSLVTSENLANTLGANDFKEPQAVAFQTYQKVSGPLMANSHPGSYTGQDAFNDMLVAGACGVDARNATEYLELNGTLQAKANGGFSYNCNQVVRVRYIVRRLTPTECARLQGFADRWGDIDEKTDFTEDEYQFWLNVRNTHATINGKAVKDYTKPQMLTWYNKLHTDSAEYKLWGNGIALPPALYCMQGMVDALDKAVTDDWLL